MKEFIFEPNVPSYTIPFDIVLRTFEPKKYAPKNIAALPKIIRYFLLVTLAEYDGLIATDMLDVPIDAARIQARQNINIFSMFISFYFVLCFKAKIIP